jgi:glycosyltransferase involved in cell wall biosynthesis
VSGFLVDGVDDAATHIAALLRDRRMRKNVGRGARQRVLRHFLLSRLLEDWLDLIADLTVKRQRPAKGRQPTTAPWQSIQ